MPDASGVVVTVEILGQPYPIRSSLDSSYVTELAAYVDQKMRSQVNESPEATRSAWRFSRP